MSNKKIIINEVKNSGFEFEKEHPEDYISRLGAIVTTPLKEPPTIFPDGHGWHGETVRAEGEMQFNENFDSFSCVIYAIAKGLVAYLKKVYGIKVTVAEMFNAFVGGVVPNKGTSVRNGLEGFRLKGWLEDQDYPFTPETTKEEYFAKPPEAIFIKAKEKLSIWKVNWEVVDVSGNVRHDKIISSLQKAPVLCSGFAWASYYGEGVYYDYNNRANHLFLVDDHAEAKDYDLLAYDSYPQDNKFDTNSEDEEFVKKLAKSYRIWSAHRIWLTPIGNINISLITKLKSMFEKICRGADGALYFVKDGKIQKLESWLDLAGALVDEIGVKNNNLTEEDLAKFEPYKFFGEQKIFIKR